MEPTVCGGDSRQDLAHHHQEHPAHHHSGWGRTQPHHASHSLSWKLLIISTRWSFSNLNHAMSSTGVLPDVKDAQQPSDSGWDSPLLRHWLSQLYHAWLSFHHVQKTDDMCKGISHIYSFRTVGGGSISDFKLIWTDWRGFEIDLNETRNHIRLKRYKSFSVHQE